MHENTKVTSSTLLLTLPEIIIFYALLATSFGIFIYGYHLGDVNVQALEEILAFEILLTVLFLLRMRQSSIAGKWSVRTV